MLNAGFQYLEQRDANDTITKDGVVGKNSPFATSDNSGIYDIIAEDLRWLKENVDDVKDTSDLEAIKQSVTDMYNTMKNDSSFGEATAKAQAEEAKKQAQEALESATNAKTYRDDVVAKSTEANETLAEIKNYIDKAEALNKSNKELEQSISDHATVATNKANEASDSATNAATSESAAKASETNAKASETAAKTSETNAKQYESDAKAHMNALATSVSNAKASESAAKTSETNSKTSEVNAKTSENNAKQYSINSSNSADLAKAWAESSDSPDSVNDTDSTTGKTQSSKSWALYAKDRAISAFKSETNAKASEIASKTSETNAKTSETNAAKSASNAALSETHAKTSETNSKASEVNAKASESNASTSKSNAATSESNAKSYMSTAKEYMQKAQEALAAAQAIQSIVDTAKADAEKCLADVEAVKESLAKMITYQGSVDNYSDLPTSPQVGYSYNIKNADKEHGVNAGDNVVWNGTDWDNFGGTIDMSLFAELGKDVNFNTVTATTFTGNLDGIATKATADGKGSNIADTYVKKSGSTMISNLAFWDGAGICSENGKYAVSLANSGMSMDVVGGDGHIGFRGLSSETYIDTATGSYHGNVVGNADTATKATQDTNGRAFTDTNAYMHISALANNTDFNNVKTTGIYYCTGNTYSNRPHNSWGILTVYSIGTVKQEYRPDDAAVYYTREYDNAEWKAWSKVNAANADTVDGVHAASLFYNKDIWDANNWATIGTYQVNGNPPASDAYGWGQVISSSTADARFQLYASDNYGGDGRLHYRTGWDSRKNQWNTILDSENYNKFVPKLIKGIIMAFSGTFENGYPVNPDTNTGDAGWHICDGTNGTPDLRGKFILGASDSHAAGSAGGEESHVLTVNEMPAHSHTGTTSTNGAHYHSVTEVYFSRDDDQKGIKLDYADNTRTLNTSTNGDHNHTFTTENSGSGAAHNNMPPYYTLSYIMKV